MTGLIPTSRRRLIKILSAVGTSTLAGCGQLLGDRQTQTTTQTEEGPPSTTIIFTDSSTESSPEKPTESKVDTRGDTLIFDGGDGAAFSKALEAGAKNPGSILKVEEGTYQLDPEPGLQGATIPHFREQDLQNITIDGNGATFQFSDPTLAGIALIDSTDITIRNLTLDYDPVPLTQGVIRAIDRDGRTITLEIDKGYPSLDHEMFEVSPNVWASVHTKDGEFVRGIRRKGDPDKHFQSIEKIDDRRFILTLNNFSNMLGLQENRKLVIVTREHHSVLRFYKVDGLHLENITVNASRGAVFSIQLCENPLVRNCTIAPPGNSNRLIGANADGVRFINCIAKPIVENCRFEYLEDDGIVVQHTLAPVTEFFNEHTIRVGSVHPVVAKVGDVFGVMSPDGTRKEDLPPVADIRIRQRSGDEDTRAKPERLIFDEPVIDKVSKGDLIGNLSTASHDFQIRNNTLRNHRASLIRVSASNGVVEDNTIEGSHQSAVELISEGTLQPFAPKSWVSNVTIRDNTISRPGLNYFAGKQPAGIRVAHTSPPSVSGNGRPNRHITISNNSIQNGARQGILCQDVMDVRLMGNSIRDLNKLDYLGFTKVGIEFVNAENAEVLDNSVRATSETAEFGIRRESRTIEASRNNLFIDGESKEARIVKLASVILLFNKAGQPGNRYLSFLLRNLALLDTEEELIVSADVGTAESGVEFGRGVHNPEQKNGSSWRWLGGADKTAALYFAQRDLNLGRYLRLQGEPFENGITAEIRVRGERTDNVSFGPRNTKTYLLDLN